MPTLAEVINAARTLTLQHGDTLIVDGRAFLVSIVDDDDADAPWEREDGHGPVRQVNGRDCKRPGERILHNDGRAYWFYDWQAACRMARKDWCSKSIEKDVQADFDRLRSFMNDGWHYVGVCVQLLNGDGEPVTDKYAHALWGIESDATDYFREVATDLATEIEEVTA